MFLSTSALNQSEMFFAFHTNNIVKSLPVLCCHTMNYRDGDDFFLICLILKCGRIFSEVLSGYSFLWHILLLDLNYAVFCCFEKIVLRNLEYKTGKENST